MSRGALSWRMAFPPQRQDMDNRIPPLIQWEGARAGKHIRDSGWRLTALEPIPTADYPTPARRPLNSRLNTSRLERAFGLRLPAWQAGVERMLITTLTP